MTAIAAAPLLCVGPQALVCGGVLAALTVGALIYGINSSSSNIDNASSAAENDLAGTDAQTCTGDCGPPPECKERENEMRKDSETIKRRINEMKLDEKNLFKNHYYEWQAHPDYGSWMGHVRQIKQVQKSLNRKRALSEKENCPRPSSSILQWLKSNAPSAPRGP